MLAGLLVNLPQASAPDRRGGIDLGSPHDTQKRRRGKRLIRQLIYAPVERGIELNEYEIRARQEIQTIAEEYTAMDFPMGVFLEGVGDIIVSKSAVIGELYDDDEDAILVLMLSY